MKEAFYNKQCLFYTSTCMNLPCFVMANIHRKMTEQIMMPVTTTFFNLALMRPMQSLFQLSIITLFFFLQITITLLSKNLSLLPNKISLLLLSLYYFFPIIINLSKKFITLVCFLIITLSSNNYHLLFPVIITSV